jgi:hypothetical protein
MTQAKPIIVVSGLPRSGTSLMMKMLEAADLELLVDNKREPDQDNPKGYYELEAVAQMKEKGTNWVAEAPGKAVKVVAPLLKYLPADYSYKVLFMRREMPEILASQKQMLARRGKDTEAVPDAMMAQIFEKQLAEVLKWMSENSSTEYIEIPFSELVAGNMQILESMSNFLKLDMDLNAMVQIADPELYRQRVN